MNIDKEKSLINNAQIGIAFEYEGNTDETDKKSLMILKRENNKTKYFNVFDTVEKKKGYKLLNHIVNYKIIKRGEYLHQIKATT